MTSDPVSPVRPPDWRNPAPARRYDVAVIGGGTAGLVCAAGAAGLGARVALIERALLGGDCLNTGCVPSKALLRAAADRVDFTTAMSRVREARASLAPHDSAARLASLGVDVFFGAAAFASRRTLTVDGVAIAFRRAVIATGSRPSIPALPGLDRIAYLTNDTIFELTRQPRELVILGGGPVGCEMAQAFARLGTQVTMIERAGQVLPREDRDAAAVVERALIADGVDVRTGTSIDRVPDAEAVLVATGRTPRLDGLGLERAGVSLRDGRLEIDERLRTSSARIFAAGDVCGGLQFTHAADAMARAVVQNALFFGRKTFDAAAIPWCTFTSPELAHVGVTSAEASRSGLATITVPLAEVDRSVIDRRTDGFVRIHHRRGRIRGATIVAPSAGELIAPVALLMQRGGTLDDLSAAVFPYPTCALALKRAGDSYRREALTPGVRAALRYYFRLLRR
jgi:pyruvate/2-oxoglutarate dehydrogenase complex dihydrolipoamide dehydrogenase (E3) component